MPPASIDVSPRRTFSGRNRATSIRDEGTGLIRQPTPVSFSRSRLIEYRAHNETSGRSTLARSDSDRLTPVAAVPALRCSPRECRMDRAAASSVGFSAVDVLRVKISGASSQSSCTPARLRSPAPPPAAALALPPFRHRHSRSPWQRLVAALHAPHLAPPALVARETASLDGETHAASTTSTFSCAGYTALRAAAVAFSFTSPSRAHLAHLASSRKPPPPPTQPTRAPPIVPAACAARPTHPASSRFKLQTPQAHLVPSKPAHAPSSSPSPSSSESSPTSPCVPARHRPLPSGGAAKSRRSAASRARPARRPQPTTVPPRSPACLTSHPFPPRLSRRPGPRPVCPRAPRLSPSASPPLAPCSLLGDAGSAPNSPSAVLIVVPCASVSQWPTTRPRPSPAVARRPASCRARAPERDEREGEGEGEDARAMTSPLPDCVGVSWMPMHKKRRR
ncbi:hypothetical protein B0H15DRAFT_1024630 [Mycena belliarum]|uniref:Uncharacterized protein n=1 Tax=Mycena belliarum TaxID=1033014 RepID=A0AAD6XL14_9AGAR|nr:hypothetical protein B0H15DRAFT_1024630 [Mycena belliae]